jgi:endonuclease/exonuclease/phosphatase family metal-dependent hydrolase
LLEHLDTPLILCGDLNVHNLKAVYPRLFHRLRALALRP